MPSRAVGAEPRDVGALQEDPAPVRGQEPRQQVEARGLAGTIRADEGREPLGLEGEIHAVEHDVAAEGLAEATRLEDGRAHWSSPVRAASASRVSWKAAGWRSRLTRPRMPSGMKRMMAMKTSP